MGSGTTKATGAIKLDLRDAHAHFAHATPEPAKGTGYDRSPVFGGNMKLVVPVNRIGGDAKLLGQQAPARAVPAVRRHQQVVDLTTLGMSADGAGMGRIAPFALWPRHASPQQKKPRGATAAPTPRQSTETGD